MYKILRKLEEKRVTSTRAMPMVVAECLTCGRVASMVEQAVQKANRSKRTHCASCIQTTFHRMTDSRIWRIWQHVVQRASRPQSKDFKRYGAVGRGICRTWLEFKQFYADMGPTYVDGLTLDRIDNTKGYSKENCRWATNAEQQANKSNNRVLTYRGETMHLAEFCRRVGASRGALTPRLASGMTPDEAAADYAASKYPKNRKSRKCTT